MTIDEIKLKNFLDSDDISQICKVSKSKAYIIIKALNDKLIKDGVPKDAIIAGKISTKIFMKTFEL